MDISIKSNILKYIFKNVYFVNGTAFAGKSTMVKLLSEKYDGVWCGENYHYIYMDAINKKDQPNLSYFDTMKDWQEFIGRTPEEYDNWIIGCSKEATDIEIVRLIRLAEQGKKVFVDTNISVEVLKEISDYHHVAVMLCPQSMSVDRFFDREDKEKQFILEQINKADNPDSAMKNYKECLERVNSYEKYQAFENSGFFTMVRTDERTIEDALEMLEKHFKL